jgi:hypothetical protein
MLTPATSVEPAGHRAAAALPSLPDPSIPPEAQAAAGRRYRLPLTFAADGRR